MLAANATTPYRKRQRRHTRIPVAMIRDRHSVRLVAQPAPGARTGTAPGAAASGSNDRSRDLNQATWEDAEWR